jgi:SAM-dependent methyltransferase
MSTSAAIESVSEGTGNERILNMAVLETLGVHLPATAQILDFGCGAGRTVKARRACGYVNSFGYDVGGGRTLLGEDRNRISVGSLLHLRLPYEDTTFDLVISDQVFEHVQDQVRVFEELYRITIPGGHALHIIRARYAPIEGHIFVPFGGALQHRWWYKVWAFEYRFAEQDFFDGHLRPSMRLIGRLGGRPAMWLYRTFRARIVYLRKSSSSI